MTKAKTCIVVAVLCVVALSCGSFGRCIFPGHANLCDTGDFDPKCLLAPCGGGDRADGGPK